LFILQTKLEIFPEELFRFQKKVSVISVRDARG